jgi:predicted lipoprotein with Yx(FWY)xxD motif
MTGSRTRLAFTALLIAVTIASGCSRSTAIVDSARAPSGSSSVSTGGPGSPSSSPSSSPPPASGGTAITVGDSQYGPMLFDQRGQAIYLFTRETTAAPACYGDCADAWPPVLTTGPPRATGATTAGLLGTTSRTDGTTQVTYAGHPLYFYSNESPGQVLCHDVREFGGTWLVVTPAGTPAPA